MATPAEGSIDCGMIIPSRHSFRAVFQMLNVLRQLAGPIQVSSIPEREGASSARRKAEMIKPSATVAPDSSRCIPPPELKSVREEEVPIYPDGELKSGKTLCLRGAEKR